ncbi:MAG: DUF3419 family protein [Magnetospirillum sp. WYHS-4]
MTTAILRSAIESTPAATARGMLERLFTLWFSRLVYTQIWEDPAVDLTALRLEPTSRVVTIASGGCNLLNYLLANPAEIVAVDLNPAHLALTRLKVAALSHTPDHAGFFRFFGQACDPANRDLYFSTLRPHLDADTRAWWETRTLTGRPRIDYFSSDFYRHGLLGGFIGFLHFAARAMGRNPAHLLTAADVEEQARIFDATFGPLFDNPLVRAVTKLPVLFYHLGIPPAQFDAMHRDAAGDMAATMRERVRRLACDFPIGENYFAWQAFGRRYDHEAMRAVPDYLRPENFALLRERAGRIDTRLGSMTDFLAAQPVASVDRVVLLDAQDWMTPAQMTALWREIGRTARPGARAIFRTAGSASPLEAALPAEVLAPWHYEDGLSKALFAQDRSAIYGGFHLYVLK